MSSIPKPVTQEEIDTVIGNARKQGVDLTQIAIVYRGGGALASQMGRFTPEGQTLDCDGNPLPIEKIDRFHYLAAD